MKLSDAIRLGAMMGPQSFDPTGEGPNGAMCANVGALKAVGGRSVWNSWPWLGRESACPLCGKRDLFATVIGVCLNDTHRWTREAIADWVATVEPQDIQNEQTDGGQVTHPTELSRSDEVQTIAPLNATES